MDWVRGSRSNRLMAVEGQKGLEGLLRKKDGPQALRSLLACPACPPSPPTRWILWVGSPQANSTKRGSSSTAGSKPGIAQSPTLLAPGPDVSLDRFPIRSGLVGKHFWRSRRTSSRAAKTLGALPHVCFHIASFYLSPVWGTRSGLIQNWKNGRASIDQINSKLVLHSRPEESYVHG